MPVEDRNISDLADQNLTNNVPEFLTDTNLVEGPVPDINNNQISFSPELIRDPYQPQKQLSIAAIIYDVEDEAARTYRVMTQKNEFKIVQSLSEKPFQTGAEVMIAPPQQGDVWLILSDKRYREEQYIRFQLTGSGNWLEVESARTTDVDADFETISGDFKTLTLPAGYYEIHIEMAFTVMLRLTSPVGDAGSATTKAGYTYQVYDAVTGYDYGRLNPVVSPHLHERPFGKLIPATAGIGVFENGNLQIYQVFEDRAGAECAE